MAFSGVRNSCDKVATKFTFQVIGTLQLSMRFQQFARRLFLFGDIAGDFGSTDNPPVRQADGRDGQGDIDLGAVFSYADGFEMFDAFPFLNTPQDVCLLVETVGGEKPGDGFADDFFGREAKDALGTLVPTRDDGIEILADDGVVTRIDDGGEEKFRWEKRRVGHRHAVNTDVRT